MDGQPSVQGSEPQSDSLDTRDRAWQVTITGKMGGRNRSEDLDAIVAAFEKTMKPLGERGIYLDQCVIRSAPIATAPDAQGTPMELVTEGSPGDSSSPSS
jgi:hypothetical protein